jgi:signal transduction histidine kinase
MGSVMTLRPPMKRRTVGIAVGATLSLVILIVALAFANSVGAGRVADNARSLHWTNASLGTASVTRAALVQAATFTRLEQIGQATTDDVEFAMLQATEAHQQLLDLEAGGQEADSLPFVTPFIAQVGATIEALHSGDADLAEHFIFDEVEPAYLELVDSLQGEQAGIQALIEANTAGAARTSAFISFFLTFAIPASAVLIYRFIAKRSVREHQIKADLEIEAEREVSRAKDEFIAGLSHELRTPLTSIYGFAEVLTDGGAEDRETATEISQIIANEAAEMTRMVDDLLAAARIDSTGMEIEMAPTRVSDVVGSAVSPFVRAGMEISTSGDEAWVTTDAARLRHVIINLLSNAARHGGSKVGVEISAAGDTVDIEVWDNGPGVPEEKLDKLFDRFAHNGSSPLLTGSLGLGLAVAHRLTAMLGGKLKYQRFVQKSYFVVRLPAAEVSLDEDQAVSEAIKAMSA